VDAACERIGEGCENIHCSLAGSRTKGSGPSGRSLFLCSKHHPKPLFGRYGVRFPEFRRVRPDLLPPRVSQGLTRCDGKPGRASRFARRDPPNARNCCPSKHASGMRQRQRQRFFYAQWYIVLFVS
jgi:hypothetical protein